MPVAPRRGGAHSAGRAQTRDLAAAAAVAADAPKSAAAVAEGTAHAIGEVIPSLFFPRQEPSATAKWMRGLRGPPPTRRPRSAGGQRPEFAELTRLKDLMDVMENAEGFVDDPVSLARDVFALSG